MCDRSILPVELWRMIFVRMHHKSIKRLRRVCTLWNCLAQEAYPLALAKMTVARWRLATRYGRTYATYQDALMSLLMAERDPNTRYKFHLVDSWKWIKPYDDIHIPWSWDVVGPYRDRTIPKIGQLFDAIDVIGKNITKVSLSVVSSQQSCQQIWQHHTFRTARVCVALPFIVPHQALLYQDFRIHITADEPESLKVRVRHGFLQATDRLRLLPGTPHVFPSLLMTRNDYTNVDSPPFVIQ